MSNTSGGLFMKQINWDDPRFAPWNIKNLGELNEAQQNAFLDDDEVRKQNKVLDCIN